MTVGRKLYDMWWDSRSSATAGMTDLVRAPALPCAGVPHRLPSTWPHRLIRGIDWLQRRAQGVFEFSPGDECLLRLAIVRAEHPVQLADGTRIERDELVAALHLWNEHLPSLSETGPSFAWVNRIRRQMIGSLVALAEYAEAAPEMHAIAAYCARIAFAARGRRTVMMQVGARFGFERVEAGPPGIGRQVHDFFDNIWLCGMLWTFNPRGLTHQGFFRDRDDYWISRQTLIDRYGRRDPTSASTTAQGEGARPALQLQAERLP